MIAWKKNFSRRILIISVPIPIEQSTDKFGKARDEENMGHNIWYKNSNWKHRVSEKFIDIYFLNFSFRDMGVWSRKILQYFPKK